MKPTIGRTVLFIVSAAVVSLIADVQARSDGNLKGNTVKEGDVLPLIISKVWDVETGCVNGQLILDGNHSIWLTSVLRSDDTPMPGCWHWPTIALDKQPVSPPDESSELLRAARYELTTLRQHNAILGARCETLDLVGRLLNADPGHRGMLGSPDLVWQIEKHLDSKA